MSFNAIANPPSTHTIPGDGWYPDIAVAEFQKQYRLPEEYAEAALIEHLELSMAWAEKQLATWREGKEAEGCEDLTSTGRYIGLLYRRAVFSHAKALLLSQYATMDRREAAKHEAREGRETEDIFYVHAQNAIAHILGRERVDVALI